MKKIAIFILLLAVLCTSCSFKQDEKSLKIGVSQCSDDAWRRTMNEEILREASFNTGVEVTIKTAYDSNQKQIRDMKASLPKK